MENLPIAALTPWGALLIVTLTVISLVVRGKLVPRETVNSLLAGQEKRIIDRDATNEDLTEANQALTEAVRTLTVQSNEMLELGRATHAVIAELPKLRGGEWVDE